MDVSKHPEYSLWHKSVSPFSRILKYSILLRKIPEFGWDDRDFSYPQQHNMIICAYLPAVCILRFVGGEGGSSICASCNIKY